MANLIFYSDAECTNQVGSGELGEIIKVPDGSWSLIYNFQTIDGKLYYLWQGSEQAISAYDRPIPSPISVPEGTGARQYVYATPNTRFVYVLQPSGTGYRIRIYDWQMKSGGQWVGIRNDTAILDHTQNNAIFEGFVGYQGDLTFQGDKYDSILLCPRFRDKSNPSVTYTYGFVGTNHSFIEWSESDRNKPTKNVRKGGRGSGVYPNAAIPALPTTGVNNAFARILSASGRGLTYYDIKGNGLEKISQTLYNNSGSLINKIAIMIQSDYNDRRESLCSAVLVPAAVPSVNYANSTNSTVFLGKIAVDIGGTGQAPIISRPLIPLDMGTISLQNYGWESFADIARTTATLYLPGYGTVNISMKDIAQGYVHVEAVLDVRNGNVLYRVLTCARDRNDSLGNEQLYGHYTANLGIPVPLGGSNASESILGSIAAMSVPLATGAIGGAIGATGGAMIGAQAVSGIESGYHVDRSGAMAPSVSPMGTSVVRLEITVDNQLIPDKFTDIAGRPAAGDEDKYTIGNDYHGFFRAADMDLDTVSATEEEKEEILRLIRGGIYV